MSRKQADKRSNLNDAPALPHWATQTGTENMATGTSIFDPVLCELAYSWFCPIGGRILDPFAGGSVRGIVAAVLGRKYTGIDLRPEQIDANRQQAKEITPDNMPVWIVGDSQDSIPEQEFDFVFSCPPYADLEVYSDNPLDISTMPYDKFLEVYRNIINISIRRLKDNSFACFVVGDVRDKKGFYYNFVSDTITAFQDAGAMLYNECILVTAVGSLPIRVGKQFDSGAQGWQDTPKCISILQR
jgi:DNA modification methylase